MRERANYALRAGQGGVLRGAISDVPPGDTRSGTTLLVRGRERQRQPWVPIDERAEFAAGISAGPENSHWYFIHR